MCANAVRGMYLSVHRSRCQSEIVKSPRPLQRLVYAVQVDGVDGNCHTNDDAVDVGKSKSWRAATAPAGVAATMALHGVLPAYLVRGRCFVVIVCGVVVATAVTAASHRTHLFCHSN